MGRPLAPTIRVLTRAGNVPVTQLVRLPAGRGRGHRKRGTRKRSLGALLRGASAYPRGQHRRPKRGR